MSAASIVKVVAKLICRLSAPSSSRPRPAKSAGSTAISPLGVVPTNFNPPDARRSAERVLPDLLIPSPASTEFVPMFEKRIGSEPIVATT